MKTPGIIYLQTCGDCIPDVWEGGCDCDKCNIDDLDGITWSKDRINDSDAVYFSEEAVRSLLRDEYKQANNIIRFASRNEIDDDLIVVEQSVNSAIQKLKGECR